MRGLLRGVIPASPSFPGAGHAGPRVALSSLTAINFGTAYTASGVGGLNSGWSVDASGNFTVPYGSVFSKLAINFNLDMTPTGSPGTVLVEDCTVLTGGLFGISLRHAPGTTIQYCTVAGTDPNGGRINYAINDINGDSAPAISCCEIYWCRIAANVCCGTVQGCYIHDFGFITGDHSDGVFMNGTYSSGSGYGTLLVDRNTILQNDNGQSGLVFPNAASAGTAQGYLRNTTISNNLLAGGGYCLYTQGGGLTTMALNLSGTTATTTTPTSWAASHSYSPGDAVTGVITNHGGVGSIFQCTAASSASGSSEPSWHTSSLLTTTTDGGVTWEYLGPAPIAADTGAVISGTGITAGTTVTYTSSPLGYTLSSSATTGTLVTCTMHNNVGISVTGNHFSTIYNPTAGLIAPATDWDSTAGLGGTGLANTWSGNVWHDGVSAGTLIAHP